MSKKETLSLKGDRIHTHIACVKGVLELTLAALTGDMAMIDTESVQMLLMDTVDKLDEVNESILQGA